MSDSSDRGTEYTGDDRERAKRPPTVQERARAMRREGIREGRVGETRRAP